MSDTPSPEAIAEAPDYEAMAAQVDLSDLAVVRRHVFTANPKQWPKPLLYALLAALEASERERDEWQIRAEVAEEIAADAVQAAAVLAPSTPKEGE